ncbi:hypothetical protein MuYL_2379 [Mucilaginibacter xinganensis]|uniref:Uncharacterized protein n=2 Tax=Mucilaginibacter xinganensis TaxID=1234841 RepID=A0A223NXF6_9SPHI|nr:hypothetical protein MuYL_2379 [Mucilaginibacter xinganensis]
MIIAGLLTVVVLATCKKTASDKVFGGTARIRGVVFYKNITTNNPDTATTAQLTLEKGNDQSTDFTLSLTNGAFDIPLLVDGDYTFNITYYHTIPGSSKSILYQLKTPFFHLNDAQFKDRDTLLLLPTVTASPTLQLTVTDNTNAVVNNAQVYLFSDISTLNKYRRTGAGSVKSGITNQYGMVVFDNLQPTISYYAASYIIRVADTLSNHTTDNKAPVISALSSTVLNTARITIIPDLPAVAFSLQVVLTDQYGAYIPGANVCIYSDKALLAKNRNTCAGSISGSVTGTQGAVNFTGLQSLFYYISAYKVVGKDTLTNKATDQTPTIVLQPNAANTTTVILK